MNQQNGEITNARGARVQGGRSTRWRLAAVWWLALAGVLFSQPLLAATCLVNDDASGGKYRGVVGRCLHQPAIGADQPDLHRGVGGGGAVQTGHAGNGQLCAQA
jgi:hypothetical protein